MILLVLFCSNGSLWGSELHTSSTGKETQNDTTKVYIPIYWIKQANIKLTERLYLKDLIVKQDSVISLKDKYIKEQKSIIADFQIKVNEVNKINLNLNKDNVKLTKRKNTWKQVAIIGGVILGGILIIK